MTPLPAGLIDQNCEIFATPEKGKCKATYQGKVIDFWELPGEILECIEDEALSDKKALATFKDDKVTDIHIITEQWAWCNLGRFDSVPDFSADSGIVQKEFFDCGLRGKCLHEFKRCKKIIVGDTYLTARETECVRFIGQGLSDKEIADKMGLVEVSMISLVQRVREKLRLRNKAEVAAFAVKMGIV